MTDVDREEHNPPPESWSERNAWLRRLLALAVVALAVWAIVQLVGRIDWAEVMDALGRLAWWQLVVLFGILMVRQVLNAMPLALFIRGLSLYKAVVNDLAAHLLAVVAPPPGDLVMRIAMFASWGVDASRAFAGTVMNMLAFYTIRFAAPLVGFLLMAATFRYDGTRALITLGCTAIAAAIVAVSFLALRSEPFAARTGRVAGSLAARVRRSVDPEQWELAMVRFRGDMQDTFARGFPTSAFGLLAMVLSDATILLLALRFVGVGAGDWPAAEHYAAFLTYYPLTLFPFMGVGLLDAVLLGVIGEVGGDEVEAEAVAGLVVWRAFTLAGPVLLGSLSMALWRHSVAGRDVELAHPHELYERQHET